MTIPIIKPTIYLLTFNHYIMKKVFFITCMLIGATSLVAFTPSSNTGELNYNDLTQTYENFDTAGLAASFTESHSSALTDDDKLWREWNKTWTVAAPSDMTAIETVLDNN
jgi:hypothetical protein